MSTRSNVRAFLCSFTFSDGRRCRTPRSTKHPHLCYFHAKKEAQSLAAENLGRDIDYFFSGKYLSACDLNAALGRLFVAVAQGLVNHRTARTLAYLAQTMSQTIHLSKAEYINAFSTDGWRNSVRTSVDANIEYLHPDPPNDAAPQSSPTAPPPQSGDQPDPSASTTAEKPNTQPHHSPKQQTTPSPSGNLTHPTPNQPVQAPHPSPSTA